MRTLYFIFVHCSGDGTWRRGVHFRRQDGNVVATFCCSETDVPRHDRDVRLGESANERSLGRGGVLDEVENAFGFGLVGRRVVARVRGFYGLRGFDESRSPAMLFRTALATRGAVKASGVAVERLAAVDADFADNLGMVIGEFVFIHAERDSRFVGGSQWM